MKSTVLLVSALLFTLLLIASEAAAQLCTKDVPCVVSGGKKGTRVCENGHLGQCTPNLDDQGGPDGVFCGGKACAAGKICQGNQCVSECKQGFTACGGTCRDLTHDSGNCGACGNACRSGTSCQPSGGSGVCACTPPAISCGGVCRNLTNDSSNCGACGNVCTAPNTSCVNRQCVPSEVPPGTAGSTGNLNLDLVWKTTDPNNLPFNPDWRARSQPAFLVKDHNAVDLTKACPQCAPFPGDPTNFEDEKCWRNCTTVRTTSDGGLFCTAGHINWLVATYYGNLKFSGYSPHGTYDGFEDDDYNFVLIPAGDEGFVAEDELQLEMSFFETVDLFESTFWSNFRNLVEQGDDPAKPLFAGRHAIVTGLLGLDVQHDGHTELHPIYGMALRETENPTLGPNPQVDCWAIFARNWGNEGFCSNHDHPQPDLTHLTFHLPQPDGATAVTEISREFKTSNNTLAFVSEVGRVGDGADITIFLGLPQERTFVNGQVCLRWALPPGAQPPQVAAPAPRPAAPARPKLDEEQYPGINLLTSAQFAQLRRSLPPTPSHDRRLDMQVPKRVPFVREKAKAQGPALVLTDRPGPVDAQKQARDRQIQGRICQMLRSHPKRPKICGQL